MPRIREDVGADPAQVAAQVDDVAVDVPEAPKRERAPRRAAPEGVSIGLSAPVPVAAPPVGSTSGRRGKPVSEATRQIIKSCQENPGQWFEIGSFLSPQFPTRTSALGSAGLTFSNERVETDGGVVFKRYAMLPVADEG